MPVSIRIEPETGIVIATCSGSLAVKDAQQCARDVWENPGWSGKPVVWDFRSAQFDIAPSEVRELAQFVLTNQPSTPPSKVAWVIARDHDFGLARMFEVFREDPSTEVRIFRDYDEAMSWARSTETDST